MLCRDPKAAEDADGRPDDYVAVQGDLVAVEDGTFEHPAIDEQWAQAYAERQGVEYERVVVDAPDAKSGSPSDLVDKGVCPWCDDYEGDGVPQHASAAHPDEWDAFKGE